MAGTKIQTFFVNVLGCKVNQYDARQIEELLENFGLTPVPGPETADIIVIHTCGVTAAAAQKSRQTVRRMRRSKEAAHVIVTGCAADDRLTGIENEPVLRVPAGEEWLRNLARQLDRLALPRSGFSEEIQTDDTMIAGFGEEHTRAFLKIQDGCDMGCTYCIVPSLRNAPRDKTIYTAIQEAEKLTRNGYREIVVTGVSVGLYGRDSGCSLADVLRRMIHVPDIGRIRMSSLHPAELTEALLGVWAASEHVMPHLHLSLQSGSDAILKAMRRNYTTEEFHDAVERARSALDNPAFTTDIIVGFPGETDDDFFQTLEFCRKIGFSRIHTFSYSPRPGTPAARMGGQVDGETAARRSDRLRALGGELSLAYHQHFIGSTVHVLVEEARDGFCKGHTEHYIPAHFPDDATLRGQVVPVDILEASADFISGVKKSFQRNRVTV